MHLKFPRAIIACLSIGLLVPPLAVALMLDEVSLPPGFDIKVFAAEVPNARQIALGPNGVVFAGSREAGAVYRIRDDDGDFVADSVETILSGLYMPSGVAFKDGVLYVAEVHQVTAYDSPLRGFGEELGKRTVFADLPKDSHHGWKAIDFGPDGHLYVPVGAPCNVCEVSKPYGSILKVDLDTGGTETYAQGVRNSVGFAWHPLSKQLWFSDNGRDWMGDDIPGCEINRVDEPGQHFGFPYVHAAGIPDDSFTAPEGVKLAYPARVLGAHVAPLGMLFYTGGQYPDEFRNRLFVAQHGSWNRTKKAGYNIMLAAIDDQNEVTSYKEFAGGWLKGQAHWGRPVDIEMLTDGSLLVSDDFAGVIYRISYEDKN